MSGLGSPDITAFIKLLSYYVDFEMFFSTIRETSGTGWQVASRHQMDSSFINQFIEEEFICHKMLTLSA